MRCRHVGPNCVEIEAMNGSISLLFSYAELVGVWCQGISYVTNVRWSSTTSKHINSWVRGKKVVIEDEVLKQIIVSPIYASHDRKNTNS